MSFKIKMIARFALWAILNPCQFIQAVCMTYAEFKHLKCGRDYNRNLRRYRANNPCPPPPLKK